MSGPNGAPAVQSYIAESLACKSHATSQQREQIRTIEDIDLIVDTDAHLREGPDEIVPYLDEPWSELYGTTDDPKRDTL